MTMTKLFSLFAATGIALSASVAMAQDKSTAPKEAPKHAEGEHKHDKDCEHASKQAELGAPAPDFTLTDTDGKTVGLSDFKGKIVVLEWFNPECPVIVQHHKTNTTFNDLYTEYKSKDVVFLGINSSAPGKQGHGKELNAKMKTEYKIEYPILLDESGDVGRLYAAKTTPHCYVIDKDGKLVYRGAIDDKKTGKPGSKNYVKAALDQVLRGETVTENDTKPYGCSVKYSSK
ncbi:MAG: thioredoxin family protein [Phycisphaerales bacterium]